MGGKPARPAISTVTIHGFMFLVRLFDPSGILCFINMIITMSKTCLLSIEANIIQLRLKTEDNAITSISLFLVICLILPKIPLTRILTSTTVFIINIRR